MVSPVLAAGETASLPRSNVPVPHYSLGSDPYGGSMSFRNARIFITGGAGTLGTEIIRRAMENGWNSQITIFSTDTLKHNAIKRLFPEVHCVVGDVRDPVTVYNAMAGHNIVVHAAAVKHIPVGEVNSIDTYEINVTGSRVVADAAIQHGVDHVIGISTDKACHPANAYGAAKYLMEKIWQEYSRIPTNVSWHLVRYGNVLESTASVIEMWKEQIARGETPTITDPNMTRFWLSPAHAAKIVEECLSLESGEIYVPKLKSLSVLEMFKIVIGEGTRYEQVPMRPGEKLHETLITEEETAFCDLHEGHYVLRPTTTMRKNPVHRTPFTSENADRLTQEELVELLKNEIVA